MIQHPMIRIVAEPEPEIRGICRDLVEQRNRRTHDRRRAPVIGRRNREFLVVLLILAFLAFGSGYALGLADGTKAGAEAASGRPE